MGPWDAFNEGFGTAFGAGLERKQRQKMLEQELAARSQLAQQQFGFDNSTLTPEMKLFQLWQQNPSAVKGFKQDLDTNPTQPTPQIQNLQYLMSIPGMTQEKAMQLAFRPDLMSQVLGAMGGIGGGMTPHPTVPPWAGGAPMTPRGGGFFGQ